MALLLGNQKLLNNADETEAVVMDLVGYQSFDFQLALLFNSQLEVVHFILNSLLLVRGLKYEILREAQLAVWKFEWHFALSHYLLFLRRDFEHNEFLFASSLHMLSANENCLALN